MPTRLAADAINLVPDNGMELPRGPLDAFDAKDGGPLGIWRQWAPRVQGQAMKGGQFFPEENPEDTLSYTEARWADVCRQNVVQGSQDVCSHFAGIAQNEMADWIPPGRKSAVKRYRPNNSVAQSAV
jgi:hypothetical protein